MAREELKTIEGWHKSECNSWDEYCKPGDMVDQGVADYFLDILPPRTMARDYFQVGEPHSHAIKPEDDEELRYICNIRCKRKRDLGVLRKLLSSHVRRC